MSLIAAQISAACAHCNAIDFEAIHDAFTNGLIKEGGTKYSVIVSRRCACCKRYDWRQRPRLGNFLESLFESLPRWSGEEAANKVIVGIVALYGSYLFKRHLPKASRMTALTTLLTFAYQWYRDVDLFVEKEVVVPESLEKFILSASQANVGVKKADESVHCGVVNQCKRYDVRDSLRTSLVLLIPQVIAAYQKGRALRRGRFVRPPPGLEDVQDATPRRQDFPEEVQRLNVIYDNGGGPDDDDALEEVEPVVQRDLPDRDEEGNRMVVREPVVEEQARLQPGDGGNRQTTHDGVMVMTHQVPKAGDPRLNYERDEVLPPPPKVGGVQIAPDGAALEVFGSEIGTLENGIRERVNPLPFKPSAQLRKQLSDCTQWMIDHVFTPEKIAEFRSEHPSLEDLCSKKWTPVRIEEAYEQLRKGVPFNQAFQVKENETMEVKGKACRPIVSCGDTIQVAESLQLKCFEHILFEYYQDESIKHKPKDEALRDISKRLRLFDKDAKGNRDHRRAYVIEGDGSAWDSCCTLELRELTELRVLKHVIGELMGDHSIVDDWMLKSHNLNYEEVMGKFNGGNIDPIRLSKKFSAFICIESIRRSGWGGTSVGNWLLNKICWSVVLSKKPVEMMHKGCKSYFSSFSNKYRRYAYAFEGDDSILALGEDIMKFEKKVVELWTSLGFRMKLFHRDVGEAAGFVGMCNLVAAGGVSQLWLPDLRRNLKNCSFSTSKKAIESEAGCLEVAAAAHAARACLWKGYAPIFNVFASLSRQASYELWEKHWQSSAFDRESAMKLGRKELIDINTTAFLDDIRPYYETNASRKLIEAMTGTRVTTEMESEWKSFSVLTLKNDVHWLDVFPASWMTAKGEPDRDENHVLWFARMGHGGRWSSKGKTLLF